MRSNAAFALTTPLHPIQELKELARHVHQAFAYEVEVPRTCCSCVSLIGRRGSGSCTCSKRAALHATLVVSFSKPGADEEQVKSAGLGPSR